MKKPLLLSSALLASFSAVSAQVTWEDVWQGSVDGTWASSTSPSFTIGGASSGASGTIPQTLTTTATGATWIEPSSFDVGTAAGTTIEFRLKIDSQASGATNTVAFLFYDVDNGAGTNDNRVELNISDTGVGFFNNPKVALDTTVYNTYRLVLGGGQTSELYLNGSTTRATFTSAIASSGGNPSTRAIMGDPGGAWGGQSEWDYIQWTNSGRFAPVPEPAAFASMIGLLALGAVLLRRRRS